MNRRCVHEIVAPRTAKAGLAVLAISVALAGCASTRSTVASTGRAPSTASVQHGASTAPTSARPSLAELNQAVTAAADDLKQQQILLASWRPDPTTGREVITVVNLDEHSTTVLNRLFGADNLSLHTTRQLPNDLMPSLASTPSLSVTRAISG